MNAGSPSTAEQIAELRERVVNVLEWGYTTGPNHPDATFEKFADQIFKVIDLPALLDAVEREARLREAWIRQLTNYAKDRDNDSAV